MAAKKQLITKVL